MRNQQKKIKSDKNPLSKIATTNLLAFKINKINKIWEYRTPATKREN